MTDKETNDLTKREIERISKAINQLPANIHLKVSKVFKEKDVRFIKMFLAGVLPPQGYIIVLTNQVFKLPQHRFKFVLYHEIGHLFWRNEKKCNTFARMCLNE